MTTERAAPARSGGVESWLRLMTWLSPGFPIGAFAFSHGLEAAIAEGRVSDGSGVAAWVETLLLQGSGWNDLVLFAEAHRAASAGDAAGLADLGELAAALAGSAERREETLALGDAFARSAAPWGEGAALGEGAPGPCAYPLAVARLAAGSGVALEDALAAFAHGFGANLVSAATRLVPLGQSAAVAALRRLESTMLLAARRAAGSTLGDLGSAALLSDIAAMRHETLRTRLFRS